MSHSYRAVGWNRQKRIYDTVLVAGVGLYLVVFLLLGARVHPNATAETLLIRGLGTAAFLLLHVILSVGPLCRLDRRFLPLLYNRRHMGVTMFLLAAAHGGFSLVQFHAFGNLNPLVSLLAGNTHYGSLHAFPFQTLGFAALLILFLMAATSHDFWLANLTAPVWKGLHMLVYVAYGLLVAHVALGVLQAETSPVLSGTLAVGLVWVLGLHLVAALKERRLDRPGPVGEGFVEVCGVDEIPEKRARIVTLAGERVAVFRYDGKVSAISNVCQHQNGPLGEGCIIDGLVTCPWHGYQYAPDTGASPAPFTEKVPTFRVEVRAGRVWVDPEPNPEGTAVEPARTEEPRTNGPAPAAPPFYVGYLKKAPPALARVMLVAVSGLFVLAVAAAVILVKGQHAFPLVHFEYGTLRDFEGVVSQEPYPNLLLSKPDGAAGHPVYSRYLLVATGKHGADAWVKPFEGQRVSLKGTLVYRDDQTMIEIAPGSLKTVADGLAVAAGAGPSLGRMTLRGEIVDSKCYLGVMSPGNLKPHRACAIRCISGGVPPVFVVRDSGGRAAYFLLVGEDGARVNEEVLDLVAEPLEIQGDVHRRDNLLVLEADPASYRKL